MTESFILDFFKAEVCDQDIIVRSDAMAKLVLVGYLIGPEKCRSELVPFLKTILGDMDQVLLILSSVLCEFVECIGGPEHVHSIAFLVEKLCSSEDVAVRSTAATSTCRILALLSTTHSTSIQALFEVYQRLCNEDGEIFYGRMSACQITPSLIHLLSPPDRSTVLELFNKLLVDELSMVRKGASNSFFQLTNVEFDFPVPEMTKMMKTMVSDENSTIRVVAYEHIGEFAAVIRKLNAPTPLIVELAVLIRAAVDDPSWKIRQVLAKNCGAYPSCFSQQLVTSELFPALIGLVQDAEPDVRISALEGTMNYVAAVGASAFLADFVPILHHLSDDPFSGVRKALCETCVDICSAVSNDSDSQALFDIVVKLGNDEDPLVRLRILKKLHIIAAETPSLCLKLTDSLKKMFKDGNWRVRKQIGRSMPSLAKFMGADYFGENFLADFLNLLKDGVDEVRIESADTLPNLVKATTLDYVAEKIFPAVRALANEDFLIRSCMLSALKGLLELPLTEAFIKDIFDLLLAASKDKVPNIRVKVAQVLGVANNKSDLRIRQMLTELASDVDDDVKFFASQSLRNCL